MTSPHRIAFIGLGAMGYPMAGHLARAGHDVTVFNRTTGRAEAWQSDYGGYVASTPAAAAKDQDAVMLCVGNDDDVREVTLGEHGALSSMRAGALLVDHTTTSEALATSLAASADQLPPLTATKEMVRAMIRTGINPVSYTHLTLPTS